MCRIMLPFSLGLIVLLACADRAEPQVEKKPPVPPERTDAFGDPLPEGAIARIGTVRYRLPESRGPQRGAARLSTDGKLLAAMGADNEINIWELPAWKLKRTIASRDIDKNRDGQLLQGLAFSPDGNKLATVGIDAAKVYLLDVASGQTLKKFALPQKNAARDCFLMLSPDDQTLVCAAFDNDGKGVNQRVSVWDLAQDKLRTSFTLTVDQGNGDRPITTVSADGRWLARSVAVKIPNGRRQASESYLELWNLTNGKMARKIELETPMGRVALSPDGKWLAAANESSAFRIYETSTGKELHNIRGRSPIQHLQFSPDGTLYVADFGRQIQRWDPASGDRTASWKSPGRPGFLVSKLVFPPQGKTLALGVSTAAIHLWEVETGKVLSPTGVPADPISELGFSPPGDLFVATEGGMTAWWNPRTGAKLRDLKPEFPSDEDGSIFILDDERGERGRRGWQRIEYQLFNLSPNGEFLACSDGALFDAKTGKLLYRDGNGRGGDNLEQGTFLDGGAKSASLINKKVRIWNTRTGRDVASFTIPLPLGKGEGLARFVASAAGTHFALETGSEQGDTGGRVLLWDAVHRKMLREWPAPQDGLDALLFSPDQQWLAFTRPQERVQLMRVDLARADHELGIDKGPVDFTQLAFSPDSRQLACACYGGESSKIQIYELASKKLRLELLGHRSGIIERLAYSPDSALLASGATDTTVFVWNAGLRGFADQPAGKAATAPEMDAWFQQLAGADAKVAFQAMIHLTRMPAQTVQLFEHKIAPVKKLDTGGKTISQWIDDLGSAQFSTRNKASALLRKLGPAAEPALRATLPNAKDVETKRRIETLLDQIAAHEWTLDELRQARAVEIVEAIGSPEGRALLERWASGDPAALLSMEAARALGRRWQKNGG